MEQAKPRIPSPLRVNFDLRICMKWPAFTFAVIGLLVTSCANRTAPRNPLADRSRQVLATALADETGFVKVHAAEALIALGSAEAARATFLEELAVANDVRPYRIGVWRVLAATGPTPLDRAQWIARLEVVVLDAAASDRVHAVESLGKLGHAPTGSVRAAIEALARGPELDAVFARWVLHHAGDPTALSAIVKALESKDPRARLRAAYVLRWLNIRDAVTLAALARAAAREPEDAVGYPYVLGSAVLLEADPERTSQWVAALERVLTQGSTGGRYDACQTLMHRSTRADLGRFTPLLDHAEADVRIAASWAILHVLQQPK